MSVPRSKADNQPNFTLYSDHCDINTICSSKKNEITIDLLSRSYSRILSFLLALFHTARVFTTPRRITFEDTRSRTI